jgi:hypothetical protein
MGASSSLCYLAVFPCCYIDCLSNTYGKDFSGHRSRRGHCVIFVCEFLAQRGQEEAGRLIVAREAKADAFECAAEVVAPLPAADEPIVVKRQCATTSL